MERDVEQPEKITEFCGLPLLPNTFDSLPYLVSLYYAHMSSRHQLRWVIKGMYMYIYIHTDIDSKGY